MRRIHEHDVERAPALGGAQTRRGGAAQGRLINLSSTLLVLAPLAVVAVLGWQHRWISDDGLINLRVVENIFAGHGPVFNTGDRVEVATSTLWLFVLVLLHPLTHLAGAGAIAVVTGLVATTAGLGCASMAAAELSRRAGRRGVLVPVGTVVLAALPPLWDFATSGLETGLIILWLGLSFLLLTHRQGDPRAADRAAWRPLLPAIVIGLGPLVRPDLALIAAPFFLALLAQSRRTLAGWLGALAAAATLPALTEVFRAGYYGTLVPNTALAKHAGEVLWHQGRLYLDDYVGRYTMVVPLILVAAALWAPAVIGAVRDRDRGRITLLTAPVIGGLLHAAYVVRLGGDFMHGRMLLPATVALTLPVAVVAVDGRLGQRLVVATSGLGVLAWALLVGSTIRVPYAGTIGPLGIADERGFYVRAAGIPNPMEANDYAPNPATPDSATRGWYAYATTAHALAQQHQQVVLDQQFLDVSVAAASPYGVVARVGSIGAFGVRSGLDVFVADELSLASWLGARLDIPHKPGDRIGHAQGVPLAWDLARYAQPLPTDSEDVRAARAALSCGDLDLLQRAVSTPMTPGHFVHNLRYAPALTRLRVPLDPTEARVKFCGQ